MNNSAAVALSKPIISKINTINNIASFKGYTWPATGLEPFSRFNLIYGWNYSGKTTVSRIFDAIGSGRMHNGHTGGSFSASWSDGSSISSKTLSTQCDEILVFNRDFTERNFKVNSDHTGAQAIAVIGQKNQQLKDRLTVHEDRSAKIGQRIKILEGEINAIQKEIDIAGTSYARIADTTFGSRQYKRPEMLAIVGKIVDGYEAHLLSDDQKKALISEWKRADELKTITKCSVSNTDLARKIPYLRRLGTKTAKNQALQLLKANPAIERWVREGLGHHKGKDTCLYCGSTISESRINSLFGHFSVAYERLNREIQDITTVLSNLSISITAPNSTDLINDLRQKYTDAVRKADLAISEINVDVSSWLSIAEKKLQSLDKEVLVHYDYRNIRALNTAISDINIIINEHNKRASDSSEIKSAAQEKVVNSIAAELIESVDYTDKLISRKDKHDEISKLNGIQSAINRRANTTRQEIKKSSIAASKINDYLRILLPGDNIEAVSISDTDFQFQRNGVVANGMSDGERTAVSLSYYFVKIEENGRLISDVILVIDDPISSLDSNHVFAVYGIIASKFIDSRQLFVLTHNSEFFSLMKDWIQSRDVKKQGRMYFVNKSVTSSASSSALTSLPGMLRKYKSDYHYLYHSLKVMHDDPNPSVESLCGSPNMIRRLLEMYLGFRLPHINGWGDKIDIIIDDKAMQFELCKFTNEMSHAHSLERALMVPDYIAHSKKMIGLVIDGISKRDPEHIASLNQAIAKL